MSKPEEIYSQDDLATRGSETKVSPSEELAIPVQEELTTPHRHWEPSILSWKSTVPLCATLVLGGIALEIVLFRSQRDQGFTWVRVSATEVRQFLKSFLAIALFLPILAWLGSAYVEMKVLQPYLDLGRGDASSRNAITTEYLTLSPMKAIRKSYARRHLLLATASCVMLVTLVFQPLAGSLFSVKLASLTSEVPVDTAGDLALSPTKAESSTPFVAAAGYVDASIYNDGYLPSFILTAGNSTGYTTPAFGTAGNVSTYSDGNATLTIFTKMLAFEVQCADATSVHIDQVESTSTTTGNWTVEATLSSDCSETFTIPNNLTGWQGVAGRAAPACITAISSSATYSSSLDMAKSPVSFGFFSGGNVASVVFCFAYQRENTGIAQYDIYGGSLSSVWNMTQIQSSPLEDYCYNGLLSSSDQYELGVGEAIGLALADAVIDSAANDGGSGVNVAQQTLYLTNNNTYYPLVDLVQSVYLSYVMIAANSIFVTGTRTPTTGTLFVQIDRLFAFAPAVHVLAVLCILTGISLAVIFYLHAQQRRSLHLADRPATLGVAAALLSRSRVSQFLNPRDTNKEIEAKLAGMKFGIDLETGAVDRVGE